MDFSDRIPILTVLASFVSRATTRRLHILGILLVEYKRRIGRSTIKIIADNEC